VTEGGCDDDIRIVVAALLSDFGVIQVIEWRGQIQGRLSTMATVLLYILFSNDVRNVFPSINRKLKKRIYLTDVSYVKLIIMSWV
jgi:hypothetical protein